MQGLYQHVPTEDGGKRPAPAVQTLHSPRRTPTGPRTTAAEPPHSDQVPPAPKGRRAAGHAGRCSPESLESRSASFPAAARPRPRTVATPASRPRRRPSRRLQPHSQVTADRNMVTTPPRSPKRAQKSLNKQVLPGHTPCPGRGRREPPEATPPV